MKYAPLLFLAGFTASFGQTRIYPDPLKNVADGYAEAIRLRIQIDAQRRLAEVQQAEADLLRAQAERQRLENDRIQQEARVTVQDSAQGSSPEPSAVESANFNAIWRSTEGRFPDLSKFRPEMVRILGLIRTNDFSTSQHIELLYLLAKYASFSKSQFATAPPEPESPKLDLPEIDLKPVPKSEGSKP